MGLHFRILSSKHEVREHYHIYDTNSFFADFGGFLGLLLGHSLFGMYCLGEEWIFARLKVVCRSKKTSNKGGSGGKGMKGMGGIRRSGNITEPMTPVM